MSFVGQSTDNIRTLKIADISSISSIL